MSFTLSSPLQSLPFNSPSWTMVGIVFFSYVLEDGALVMAALLAAAGTISPVGAWGAVFFGIFTGDLGVYLLARRLRRPVAFAQNDLPPPTTRMLVLCRFTPGLRTIGYGWSGWSRVPLRHFINIIFWSGLAWTLMLFILVYVAGAQVEAWLGHYTTFVIPAVIASLWWWRRPRHHQSITTDTAAHD